MAKGRGRNKGGCRCIKVQSFEEDIGEGLRKNFAIDGGEGNRVPKDSQ